MKVRTLYEQHPIAELHGYITQFLYDMRQMNWADLGKRRVYIDELVSMAERLSTCIDEVEGTLRSINAISLDITTAQEVSCVDTDALEGAAVGLPSGSSVPTTESTVQGQ